MSVAFRTEASTDTASSTTGSAAMPSGITVGDLLILQLDSSNAGVAAVITTPAGWSVLVAQTLVGSFTWCAIYYKVAVGGEGTLSITSDNALFWHTTVSRVSGADTTTPINASATTNSNVTTGTLVTPSITTTVDACLIVSLVDSQANAGMTYTAPAGMTQRSASVRGTQTGLYQAFADVLLATGPTGTKTWSLSSNSFGDQLMATVAIAPPAPPAGAQVLLPLSVSGGLRF